jgi:CubicO group peptidase (beta-lactamase class C family)
MRFVVPLSLRADGTPRRRLAVCLRAFLLPSLVLSAPVAAAPDAAALEAFVDGKMAAQFASRDLVGAVVMVVEAGETTFARGYGYADLEARTPVDPDRTLFRIGSITKLFVWTAVMQLVEQGGLDLNADVNAYLSTLRVPDSYPEPVTMAHLMAHTAGFEDRSVGLFARTPDAVGPLAELLDDGLPARVRPVGEAAAYSNHGAALAGLVVEELSGLAWNDYLDERLLAPLGMTRSTGRQPVPAALAGDLAVGYDVAAGSFVRRAFDVVPLAAAGSMSATGSDMARFMLAHLQGGAHGGGSILGSETVQAMHRTHATQDPRLSGSAHGFIEQTFQGRRTIGHGGGIVAFTSLMVLVPDDDLGLFLAYNTAAGAAAAADFVADFFAFRYEAPDVAPANPDVHRPDAAASYRPSRVAHTTLDKLAGLLQAASITSADDGSLVARNLGTFGTTRWVPVEPRVYREVASQDLLVFHEDGDGRIVRALLGSQPVVSFERLAWHQSTGFHAGLVAIAVVAFLSAVVGWPLTRRWRRGGTTLSRLARPTAWAASAAFLVFLGGLGVVLRDPMEIAFGVPPLLRVVFGIALVGTALTLAGVMLSVRAWVRGDGSVPGRVHHSIVVAAGVAFVWFLNAWNLLGFRY